MNRIEIAASDILVKKHRTVLVDAIRHNHTHYTMYGGRGGFKSTATPIIILLLMLQPDNADVNALVLKKRSTEIRDYTYANMMYAIELLQLSEWFKSTVSPFEITYRPTGQRIIFRGVDDRAKIKSIKTPQGRIGITWFEECDQFEGREEIRDVLRSTMRGGGAGAKFWNFESFNPPITRDNWANIDLLVDRPDRLTTKTSYLDGPIDWISQAFHDEAEYMKLTDPTLYEHIYMGVATGTGGNVFDRIEARTISDSFINKLDRIYQGIDWGWYPDPFAFVRLHYDSARHTVFILDELYVNKWSNEDAAQWMTKRKYNLLLTICDSQEPKSIFDMQRLGVRADGAIKGPGSVEYGMKWLQRRKIVVDPKRTPNIYKELLNYEYERDRQGNIISGYPDKNNHGIDAIRYALEKLMRGSKTVA